MGETRSETRLTLQKTHIETIHIWGQGLRQFSWVWSQSGRRRAELHDVSPTCGRWELLSEVERLREEIHRDPPSLREDEHFAGTEGLDDFVVEINVVDVTLAMLSKLIESSCVPVQATLVTFWGDSSVQTSIVSILWSGQ